MNALPLEIERKYLIEMPDSDYLDKAAFMKVKITQTYLLCHSGMTVRVRRSIKNGQASYTTTEKERLSDVTRIEREREISRDEYNELLTNADPSLRVMEKLRYKIRYEGLVLEIDVFPFWSDKAIMEIELQAEDQPTSWPDNISMIREVTADRRYTNRAMAFEIPTDD